MGVMIKSIHTFICELKHFDCFRWIISGLAVWCVCCWAASSFLSLASTNSVGTTTNIIHIYTNLTIWCRAIHCRWIAMKSSKCYRFDILFRCSMTFYFSHFIFLSSFHFLPLSLDLVSCSIWTYLLVIHFVFFLFSFAALLIFVLVFIWLIEWRPKTLFGWG